MKLSLLSLVFLSLLLFFSSQAQQQIFSINPEHPKAGDRITITYDASAPGALLANAKEITMLCLAYRGENDPLVMETAMTSSGSHWKGSLTLSDPEILHLAFQFVYGETYDDNGRSCWTSLIYGKDDKPVRGSYFSLATVLLNGGNIFGENKDLEQAKGMVSDELSLYADNPDAQLLDIRLRMDNSTPPSLIESFRTTLAKLAEQLKTDEKMLFKVCGIYAWIGDTAKASEIENAAIEKNPRGYLAIQKYFRPYSQQKNTDSAAALLQEAISSFPDMEEKRKQSFTENIAYRFANGRQFDKAIEWLKKIPKPDGTFFNYVARTIIENSGDLETAASLAQQAIALNRAITPDRKPSYSRQSEWEESNKTKLAASLGTYGNALMKLERNADALPVLKESYDLYGGTNVDVNQRFVWALRANKLYDSAIAVGIKSVKELYDNAKLLDDLRQAYTGRDGSEDKFSDVLTIKKQVFAETIEKAGKEHADEIKKKIENERTSKPAPDFTLNDLNGVPVTLSALKGKVVIIDFWATWCGPCKQSFPYLQYVYEEYQHHNDVKILAVNTWERITGKQAIFDNTKRFLQLNNYTFPVVFDDNAVSEYDVEGIPTKFIIDKKGNIAYTSVGFDGPQMVEEMRQAIELLLKEGAN